MQYVGHTYTKFFYYIYDIQIYLGSLYFYDR